ncbi:Serine/threonine-protein kinase DCLK [Penicillium camemberti]|uniref:Serine/threonine-protein kinase DCLK n=1 Tax=Penicillium camemberti (strain FM 013) TaxID=1429867 RepID=A0A0G4PBU9_PENC3|nr:Serine/threonine-protein kinase DCLK [Penicillium camemberti]
MYSVISPNLSRVKGSLARTMSSLSSGHVVQGACWNYSLMKHVKGDHTHTSDVFKAQVVPRENAHVDPHVPEWALVKKASNFEYITTNLQREVNIYGLPGVASAQCFRKMYEKIDDSTIALEWLDTTLAEVKYRPDIRTYSIINAVLKAAFTSCLILEDYKYVNTDYKPANILLSNINTNRPIAKVGDLGLVVPVGELFDAQPYAMRAPEVFLGEPCTEPSQVWAVAAMLLCWIKPGLLGAWGSPLDLINEAWSMAKIKRLFPQWEIPTLEMVKEVPALQAILPFDGETKKVDMPQQLRDLLRYILVPNPKKRPSASSVLASKEFRDFEHYVSV